MMNKSERVKISRKRNDVNTNKMKTMYAENKEEMILKSGFEVK